jgi:hypothetical protein
MSETIVASAFGRNCGACTCPPESGRCIDSIVHFMAPFDYEEIQPRIFRQTANNPKSATIMRCGFYREIQHFNNRRKVCSLLGCGGITGLLRLR